MLGHLYRNHQEQMQDDIQMYQQPQNLMADAMQQVVQPMEEEHIEEQNHQGAANVVMNRQQQNARNKGERRQIRRLQREERRQEEARIREEQIIKEKTERAERITLSKQVVMNAEAEQVRKYGCASYQQTVTIEEAKKVVEESGGFLFYKEVGHGLAELRPTLPEKLEIDVVKNHKKTGEKKEIPFRKIYNSVISKLAQCTVDKKGRLMPNAAKYVGDLAMAVQYLGIMGEDKNDRKLLKNAGFDEETIAAIDLYNKRGEEAGDTFLPNEIVNNFCSALTRISRLGDMSRSGIRQRQNAIKAKMIEENHGEPLSEEQLMKVAAVPQLYEDASKALKEILKLRDLDIDGQEVALPNACSANARFQESRRILTGKNHEKRIMYSVVNHVEQHLEQHIQYIINNIEWIAEKFEYNNQKKNEVLEQMKQFSEISARYKQKEERGEIISKEEEEQIQQIISQVGEITVTTEQKSPGKYVYHKMGVASVLEDGYDGITYTIETFAAEEKQYVVSPFTLNAAIGRYHGKPYGDGDDRSQKSVNAYYNMDNPLPDYEERILAEMKVKIASGLY